MSLKKTQAIVTILIYGAILLAGFSRTALAHATPVTYEPDNASVQERAPERIRIRFSERIESGASSITIFGPDGSRADRSDALVDQQDAHIFSIGFLGMATGTYAVSWLVVSADDGHFTKGAFVFSVGAETNVAGAVNASSFEIIHATTFGEGITTWLELTGQAALLGGLVFLFLWRFLGKITAPDMLASAEPATRSAWSLLVFGGVVLIIGGGSAYITVITNQLAMIHRTDFVSALKTSLPTVTGSFTFTRVLLALMFISLFLWTRKTLLAKKSFSTPEAALWISLLLMALSRARVSHAAASSFYPLLSVAINFFHLLFKELWTGWLLVSVLVALPLVTRLNMRRSLNAVLAYSSRMLIIAFGGIAITGVYIVWLHLKSFANIGTTQWGAGFLALLIFSVILVGLRFLYFWLTRNLLTGSGIVSSSFQTLLRLETLVALGVVFGSSFLIITTPPLSITRFERSGMDRGVTIIISEHEAGSLFVAFQDAANGQPVLPAHVVVAVTNEERSIGPIVVPVEPLNGQGYILKGSTLSPPGLWRIEITGQRPNSYDANALFTLDYPKDVQPMIHEGRSFGSFEMYMVLLALGVLATTLILYFFMPSVSKALALADAGTTENDSLFSSYPAIRSWAIAFVAMAIISGGVWTFYKNAASAPCAGHAAHQNPACR